MFFDAPREKLMQWALCKYYYLRTQLIEPSVRGLPFLIANCSSNSYKHAFYLRWKN